MHVVIVSWEKSLQPFGGTENPREGYELPCISTTDHGEDRVLDVRLGEEGRCRGDLYTGLLFVEVRGTESNTALRHAAAEAKERIAGEGRRGLV